MKKLAKLAVVLILTGVFSAAHARTRDLNPQPLPPGMQSRVQSKVQVNPQPLPPSTDSIQHNSARGSKIELNPQPLPPGSPQASKSHK
jgi:hypothetical protein